MADTSSQTMADTSYPTGTPSHHHPSGSHHFGSHHKHCLILYIIIGILVCIIIALNGLSIFLIVQMRRRAATIQVTANDLGPIGLPRAMTLEQAQREEMQAKANGQQSGTVLTGEKTVLGPIVEGKE